MFAARGTVTAGNSSQTSDGAGALILASDAAVKRFGLTPLARFVSFASRGVPPHIMGIGPIEAIPAALRYAGLKQDDIDWIELNEAFAAQSLAVIKHARASMPPRSIPWAARSRWVIRSARPVLSDRRQWCTPCSARI